MTQLFGMRFASLNYLYLLPIIFIICFITIYKLKKINKTVNILSNNSTKDNFLINFSYRRNLIKIILFITGLFFLFFALLSPQWNEKPYDVSLKSRDLFIALDISRSMLAKDVLPNRLEFAKEKIKTFIKQLDSDRIGLILFAGSAFVQCPLTVDRAAFSLFLDSADVETVSHGTTALDQAIKVALDKFKQVSNKKDKLLVIFTDGEDFSTDLASLYQEIKNQNLHIFSVGVGTTQGAPIPLFDQNGKQIGHQLDQKGSVVISRLNEGILSALSAKSGAFYIKSTTNNDDLSFIINKILNFEQELVNNKKIIDYENQYYYFIFIAFICFCLEWIL